MSVILYSVWDQIGKKLRIPFIDREVSLSKSIRIILLPICSAVYHLILNMQNTIMAYLFTSVTSPRLVLVKVAVNNVAYENTEI